MQFANILKAPIWFIELFTTAKSFTANPIIGNRTLNRLGLHTGRIRLAQAMTQWRWLFMGWMLPAELRRQYRTHGVLKIENFLSPEEFAQVRAEIVAFNGDLRRMTQGDTHTFQGLLDDQTIASMPATNRLLADRHLRRIMMYGGSSFKLPMFFAHCVRNGVDAAKPGISSDPQKDFHSDTFHPTMKAWLFLDDVDDKIGPFNYVPGSQKATTERLEWDYENSIAGKELANNYAKRGSLRISPAELKDRGFAEPIIMRVPANTLVMADTHGFHRRGDAVAGSTRLAIYAYSRSNPFNPLPGFAPVSWRSRIEQFFTRRALQAADQKAARNNARASWHQVPATELAAITSPAPDVASDIAAAQQLTIHVADRSA